MRLIDADEFKKQMASMALISPSYFTSKVVKLLNIIDKQPTVEAVPVEAICDDLLGRYKRAHGEWIYNQYHTWECGNCGFHPFKGFIPKEPGFNFCPNCGADMRKKV